MRYYRVIAMILVLAACKTAQVANTPEDYQEDLSVLRPEIPEESIPTRTASRDLMDPVELTGHITEEIDSINRIVVAQNMERNSANGYTIQVYVGINRDEANWAQRTIEEYYPDLAPKLSYRQPNYRVKAGEFYDRLEATRVYNEIKTSFPKAILLPEKFALIKGDE